MKRKILATADHRNGSDDAPFHVFLFEDAEAIAEPTALDNQTTERTVP